MDPNAPSFTPSGHESSPPSTKAAGDAQQKKYVRKEEISCKTSAGDELMALLASVGRKTARDEDAKKEGSVLKEKKTKPRVSATHDTATKTAAEKTGGGNHDKLPDAVWEKMSIEERKAYAKKKREPDKKAEGNGNSSKTKTKTNETQEATGSRGDESSKTKPRKHEDESKAAVRNKGGGAGSKPQGSPKKEAQSPKKESEKPKAKAPSKTAGARADAFREVATHANEKKNETRKESKGEQAGPSSKSKAQDKEQQQGSTPSLSGKEKAQGKGNSGGRDRSESTGKRNHEERKGSSQHSDDNRDRNREQNRDQGKSKKQQANKKGGGKGHKHDEKAGPPFSPKKSVIGQDDQWWMYYDKPEDSGNMTQDAFEDSMNLLGTFNNMAQFWDRFGDMGFENLPTLASLRTFKKGITPSWEHPANHNGGKWIVVIPKLQSVGVFNEVLAAVISGRVQHVNGVLLAKKRREDLVNVWTAEATEDDLEAIREAIAGRLKKNLGIDADISFKAHGAKKAQKTAKGAGITPSEQVVNKVVNEVSSSKDAAQGKRPGNAKNALKTSTATSSSALGCEVVLVLGALAAVSSYAAAMYFS